MTVFIIFLFGLIVGSFLNVVILRIPQRESIRGRSRCVSCQKTLRWFELIPLASYVMLRGKCGSCRTSIALQYPLVELATALLFLFVFVQHRELYEKLPVLYIALIRDWFFIAVLIVLFVQDLRFQILPDIITLPAIAVAITFNILIFKYLNIFAIAIGGGFFLLQWLVSRGRWVGGGDIRLGALMGAILGWPNILLALFLAYVSGAIVGGTLLILKRATRKSQIPFGTFLTASTGVTMFWGERIVTWYAKVIGLNF